MIMIMLIIIVIIIIIIIIIIFIEGAQLAKAVLSGALTLPPGGVLKEFLGGDVPLGPWNP